MKFMWFTCLLLAMCIVPTAGSTEVWSYACAEAMTLLNHAQQDVAQKHRHLYQSKLELKLFPDGSRPCRKGHRGIGGGQLHCVDHRAHGGISIKEVIQAERVLSEAMRTFDRRLQELQQACSDRH